MNTHLSFKGIVDFDNKSVTLRWNKPTDTGGRPITHFIIQVTCRVTYLEGKSKNLIIYRRRTSLEAGLTLSSRTTTTVPLPLRSWRPEFLGLARENGKFNHLFGA